jgi:hypothetical protein
MLKIDNRIQFLEEFWNERRIDQPQSNEDLIEFFIDEVSK